MRLQGLADIDLFSTDLVAHVVSTIRWCGAVMGRDDPCAARKLCSV